MRIFSIHQGQACPPPSFNSLGKLDAGLLSRMVACASWTEAFLSRIMEIQHAKSTEKQGEDDTIEEQSLNTIHDYNEKVFKRLHTAVQELRKSNSFWSDDESITSDTDNLGKYTSSIEKMLPPNIQGTKQQAQDKEDIMTVMSPWEAFVLYYFAQRESGGEVDFG